MLPWFASGMGRGLEFHLFSFIEDWFCLVRVTCVDGLTLIVGTVVRKTVPPLLLLDVRFF